MSLTTQQPSHLIQRVQKIFNIEKVFEEKSKKIIFTTCETFIYQIYNHTSTTSVQNKQTLMDFTTFPFHQFSYGIKETLFCSSIVYKVSDDVT